MPQRLRVPGLWLKKPSQRCFDIWQHSEERYSVLGPPSRNDMSLLSPVMSCSLRSQIQDLGNFYNIAKRLDGNSWEEEGSGPKRWLPGWRKSTTVDRERRRKRGFRVSTGVEEEVDTGKTLL